MRRHERPRPFAAAAHGLAPELCDFLGRLRVSRQVATLGSDLFVPILLPSLAASETHADLLDEGLESGVTALREVDEHGDVNRVLVSHAGQRLLLLVDGEQILGAKQNRVFNASFLVAPGSRDVIIPVSCVERGRWKDQAHAFSGSETTLTGTARSRKLSRVTQSVITGGGYDAEQREVWRDVDEYLERSRVVSTTRAFEDAVVSQREITRTGLRVLSPLPEQVGVALVRDGKLVLMDVFGSPSLYARGYRKIAAGMIADGVLGADGEADTAPRVVAEALLTLSSVQPVRRTAPGCGETLHGEAAGLSLGAVVYEGHVYHAIVGAA